MVKSGTHSDRHQLVIALPIVVLTAAAMVGIGVIRQGTGEQAARASLQSVSPHHVNWVDTPAASETPAATCTSSDVQLSVGAIGGAMQRVQVPVEVQNTSNQDCTFDASSLTLASGARSDLVTSNSAEPVLVPANSSETVSYSTPAICGGEIVEASKDVAAVARTDDGTDLSATTLVPSAIAKCGMLEAAPATDVSSQDAGTGPFSSLRAAIMVPEQPVQGDDYHYIVRLSNDADTAFTFGQCPNIDQAPHYGDSGQDIETTLNCASSGSISAGGYTDFEMVVPAQRDGAQLSAIAWSLDDGPSAAIRL